MKRAQQVARSESWGPGSCNCDSRKWIIHPKRNYVALLERAGKGCRRESHSGPARVMQAEVGAERRLQVGMQALGMDGAALRGMCKGAPEKAALAWWLRERTTVPLAWVAERLGMGHASRVSQAVARMRRRPGRRLRQLQRKLKGVEMSSVTE